MALVAKEPQVDEPRERGSVGFQCPAASGLAGLMKYEDLTEVSIQECGVIMLEFVNNGIEHVTLKVTLNDNTKETRDKFEQAIREKSLGRTWVHQYDPTVLSAFQHLAHACAHGTCSDRIFAVIEFLVDFPLKLTLFAFDVKDVRKEGRWPLCFVGAMFWLAVFSFCMLEVANEINFNLPMIPISFLGITVCAIGTSFPNAVASVIMAQQNKPAAAVANALGSNVQNVFLAMALPWVIYGSSQPGMTFAQGAKGINEGVVWMGGTLLLLVIFVLIGACKLSKIFGYILMALYFVYLGLTCMETFNVISPLIPDSSS